MSVKGAPKGGPSISRVAKKATNGVLSHPGKSNTVRNRPSQPARLGRDSFSDRQAKPRASIK